MADLGNFLDRKGGIAQTGREVTFNFLSKDSEARAVMTRMTATLLPVDPVERREAFDAAEASVEKDRGNSTGDLEHEQALQLLARALRDSADLRRRFVGPELIDRFRKGLILQQVRLLLSEYEQMLLDQYPDCFTEKERERIRKQAESFSAASPEKPTDSSPEEAPLLG